MKTFRRIYFLLIAAFTLNSRAASGNLVKITGTVVDAKGMPVVDAQVDCDYYSVRGVMALPDVQSRQHTTTDSTGAYTLSVPRGALTIIAQKAGLAAGWKTLQSIPNGPIEALTLGTPSFLAGVVVDEKGQPVAGAEVSVSLAADRKQAGFGVQQPNFIFGKTAGELFSARTSADGRFRIEGFPAGAQANLAVKASGQALRPAAMAMNGFEMQAQAGDKDIKLVTDPAANIEGKVVMRDTGEPLAGAKLQWMLANSRNWSSVSLEAVQSGADGSFRISDLAGGSYRLTAIFTNEPIPLWVAESVPVTVAAGETAHDIKIQASKGGVVQVSVVSKGDHKGVPEVNVSANSPDYNSGAKTGDDGVAYLRLPPGVFNLFAMKQGMSPVQEQTTVTDSETNRVTLEMDLPAKISGIVRDASGSPVANTSVGVFPDYTGGAEVKTDAAGHYEVAWQKPAWAGMQNQSFYVVARNAELNLAAIHEIDDKTRTLDLDLKPASSVSGRAQDAKGNTITNATGFVLLQTDNMGFMISRQQVSADEHGKIEMAALPGGQRYALSVFAEGYGSGSQTMVTPVTDGGHYDFAPIVLKLADRKLAGRVLGTDGKPVAGANVFMNGEGQPNGNAMTDADGRFAFDAVCEGNINISANSQGHSGSINATGGDTNVVIRFDVNQPMYSQMGSLQVSGSIYDPSGNPAGDARVVVVPSWGMVDSEMTDTNGEYTLHWQDQRGMRNVKYFVLARDIERNLAGMEPIDAKKTNASVRLQPGFSFSGTVLDTNGMPLRQANVNLNILLGNSGSMVDQRPVRVDADGNFTISALPPGQQYGVYISASGYGSRNKMISKAQSRSNSFQLPPFKLRVADREIAGRVLDKDGKPLSGAWVNTYGNNQPNGNMRTDSEGHFKFKVCSGPIYVSANSQSGGQYGWGQTEARGGEMNVVVKMGDTGQRGSRAMAAHHLLPQPWTLGALIAWPASHQTGAVVLLSLQMAMLLGTGGGIFWFTRKPR